MRPVFIYFFVTLKMNELADTLAKTFNECLESILLDPQQQQEEGNEGTDEKKKNSLSVTFPS